MLEYYYGYSDCDEPLNKAARTAAVKVKHEALLPRRAQRARRA